MIILTGYGASRSNEEERAMDRFAVQTITWTCSTYPFECSPRNPKNVLPEHLDCYMSCQSPDGGRAWVVLALSFLIIVFSCWNTQTGLSRTWLWTCRTGARVFVLYGCVGYYVVANHLQPRLHWRPWWSRGSENSWELLCWSMERILSFQWDLGL
jgi:hypothetical protein